MDKLLIIGGGDLAKQICHHLSSDSKVNIIGFVDDTVRIGDKRFGQKCLGKLKDIPDLFENKAFDKLVCGIGYKHLDFRKKLFEKLSDFLFYSFVDNHSIIDKSVKLGKGIFISPGVVLEQNVCIGDNVFIYNSVSISHDSKIGANSFLAPCVAIAGFVKIGENCNIGINSTIINNLEIVDNVQTGGGTVVIENISLPGLYVGNPARFLR